MMMMMMMMFVPGRNYLDLVRNSTCTLYPYTVLRSCYTGRYILYDWLHLLKTVLDFKIKAVNNTF
jgi:hypothetical protein